MSTKQAVIDILEDIVPGIDYEAVTDLVDSHYLDSLTMIALIAEFEDAFDIEVPPVHVTPENFNSVDAIAALVERLKADEG